MNADELLERTQWDTFWVPPGTTVVDRPGLLYLAHPSGSPPLNSVLRLRAPDGDWEGRLAEAARAHQTGISRLLVNPQNHCEDLLEALHRMGYLPSDRHHAYVVDTARARPPLRDGLTVRRVDDMPSLATALDVANRAFGQVDQTSETVRRTWLEGCAAPRGRVHRFVVLDRDDRALASAGMTVFPALRFAFLWAGGTIPEARGQGAYTALVTARLAWARSLGAEAAGLYARVQTSAPIVAAQGFAQHGPMTFWERLAVP